MKEVRDQLRHICKESILTRAPLIDKLKPKQSMLSKRLFQARLACYVGKP